MYFDKNQTGNNDLVVIASRGSGTGALLWRMWHRKKSDLLMTGKMSEHSAKNW